MGYSPFQRHGVTHCVLSKAYCGLTLFCPMLGDVVYLVDISGSVVHQWRPPLPPLYGFLLDNGHLLVSGRVPNPQVPLNGIHGAIFELDWDGSVVWQHVDPTMHHDHARLRNGNTLVLRWAPVPTEIAREVVGGRPGSEDAEGRMWGDELLEIATDGRVVWQWHSYDVFDPKIDVICPLEHRAEWGHQNAVEELSSGDLLVSYRVLDTVGIIDRASGQFRWKWGRGQLGHQHDPTELANGN